MKKIAIMQPYFSPYLGYFQLIKVTDIFIILDVVSLIKGGYIARNNVLNLGAKQAQTINLHCKNLSNSQLINSIEIDSTNKNNHKIMKTLERNYKLAPFYKEVASIVEQTIYHSNGNLAKVLSDTLQNVCSYLGLKTDFLVSSKLKKNNSLKLSNRIIDICKNMDANVYINTIGGQSLYEKDFFMFNNVELFFIKMQTESINYEQIKGCPFIPNLSIIDVMMFNDVATITKILDKHELL